MTQRILTGAAPVLPVRPARREPRWVSLGEAVSAVFDSLFDSSRTSPLPPEVLRDHDRELQRATTRTGVERERERLAATRPPLLY